MPSHRKAFSLAEAAVAVVIVGLLLVASLATLSGTRTGQFTMEGRATGSHLAQELMNEILSTAFEEQEDDYVFGRESGESSSNRSAWDDVDDYNGLSESPPKYRDGTSMPDLSGWTRTVTVSYVNPADFTQSAGSDSGMKRIIVTVKRGTVPVAVLTAIRSEAWPMEEVDDNVVRVLMITKNNNPTWQENKRKELLESWGFTVTTLKDSSNQSQYSDATAEADVVLIPEEVNSSTPGSRLRGASIGVVNGDAGVMDDLGICDKSKTVNTRWFYVSNTSHYITSEFSYGWLRIFDWNQQALASKYTHKEASGSDYLGWFSPQHALLVIEQGGGLWDGGSANGRRVQLPWGGSSFDSDSLSDDGKTILMRSLIWAAKKDAGAQEAGSSGHSVRPGRRNCHRNRKRNCDGHHSCRN